MKGIQAFIGPNGAGKTTAALLRARAFAARKGVKIYSNVSADGVELIEDYDQLSSLRHCVVILDEILAIAGSRESRSLPRKIQLWLTTLRHSDVILFWTSPTFERADVLLREVTTLIHFVSPIRSKQSPERLWLDTTHSLVVTRSSSQGEPDGGFGRLSLIATHRLHGSFQSHGDVSPFE